MSNSFKIGGKDSKKKRSTQVCGPQFCELLYFFYNIACILDIYMAKSSSSAATKPTPSLVNPCNNRAVGKVIAVSIVF